MGTIPPVSRHEHEKSAGNSYEVDLEIQHSILGVSATLNSMMQKMKRTKLRYETLPVTNLDENIVGWDSQEDPAMPLNFSSRDKWTWVGLLSIYGRKPVLTAANVFFCLWQIGCVLAPNIETLIVSRFFSGVGGAGCLTLGGVIVGDLFRPDQRGFAIGVWNIGPLLGPTVGPVIGGFLTKFPGWRYDFWIVFAASSLVTILIQMITRETNHKVLIQRKTVLLRAELGQASLKSCYDNSNGQGTSRIILTGLIRPLKMLVLSPIVLLLSLYIAFVFGTVYLLYTTIPAVFEKTYGFNVDLTGLVYLSLGLDRTIIRLAQANDGHFEPEMRLMISIYFGIFLPVTLFWYGWSAANKNHWASTLLSLTPYGFGIMGLFLPITTYLVDRYPMYSASASAANIILRSTVGALLPLAGPPLYDTLGLGWDNSLLGFICIAMIPLPIIFYKFEGRLRKAERLRL
ncbi:major facilitator superfamily domain-containing protein [Xylaria bambusicola]|uniref:major facilitator superfamily domain-containing protein n=1 Tax=Xylaria bambusicola TaxID=326684 RepID=UPI0020078CFF|nr:major facilitator superfamily domain-containing protein [Xylaria bambusicola]KAI0517150.1 major facilitator superfamily domain-containing protein [Xylaria bambusicola]